MLIDRLAVTYCAAPMRGHRTYTDVPPFRRASLATPVDARPSHSLRVEAAQVGEQSQ